MARVTVEDCIENVENRYELVVVAARRAKDISAGSPLTVDRDNDKDSVVALREIADRTVKVEDLREGVVTSFQQRHQAEKFARTDAIAAPKDAKSVREEIEQAFAEEAPVRDDRPVLTDKNGMSFADDMVEVDD